jgi:leader peptidase (prepilin peptidase)/N-methyltransferase
MQYVFGAIIFLFGSALGSFVAVIGNRYNTGKSFLKGRSICFSCNTELSQKDLVPIFSFLYLNGKCRYCRSKIPKDTLIVEILMGVLSVLAAFKSSLFNLASGALSAQAGFLSLRSWIAYLIITAIFGVILLISIYDLKHFIIPDSFLISFFILSSLYFLFFKSLGLETLISPIVLSLPFLLIFLVSKGTWFGFGDIKYILVLSFFLGFSQGLSAVVLAFWIGAAFSITLLSLKKLAPRINLPLLKNNLTIKSEIPFGPFLSIGIIISFFLSLDLFQIHEIFNIL